MTTIILRLTFFCFAIFSITNNALASAERIHFGAEFDPGTTLVGTQNLFLVGDLTGDDTSIATRITASVGLFKADFPRWLQNIFSYRNRDEGISSRIRLSPGGSIDYFLESTNKAGWHVGTFVFLWRYQIETQGQKSDFSRLVLLPRLGFRWYPLDHGLYFDPFLGLMTEIPISGNTTVAGKTHKPTPILPFASVHVGYRF